jgi:hypothetical protein
MNLKNALKAVAAVGLFLAIPARAVIVYDNTGIVGNELLAAPLRLGMDFQVNAGGYVTAIGAFDNGGDGFLGLPIEVGIFDVGSSTLVPGTFAVFTGAVDPLIGGSRFKAIAPVFLSTGTYSIVAANYGNTGGLERNFNTTFGGTPPTFDNAVGSLSMLGHREDVGLVGLAFPTGSIFSGPNPIFGAGTFDFTPVPEPETYGLAAIAMLGLVYVGRNLVLRRKLA